MTGFFEWEPFVTDWSRDLFDGGERPESDFAVAPNGSLRVIAFDGQSADEANAARAGMPANAMMWLPVAGLDRHTPVIGLRPLSDAAAAPAAIASMLDALYRPISPLYTARA